MAQTTNAVMTREDLKRELDALRSQRQALAFELREGHGRAEDLEEVEERIAHAARRIEWLELAEVEAEARARAEAAAQHAARRRGLLASIETLDLEDAGLVEATEAAWRTFAEAASALLAHRVKVYGAVAELRFSDGEKPRGADQKLLGKEALGKWLAWRCGTLLPYWIERPGSHFWAGALQEVLAHPMGLADENGAMTAPGDGDA